MLNKRTPTSTYVSYEEFYSTVKVAELQKNKYVLSPRECIQSCEVELTSTQNCQNQN